MKNNNNDYMHFYEEALLDSKIRFCIHFEQSKSRISEMSCKYSLRKKQADSELMKCI
jgi:hypothetical protein